MPALFRFAQLLALLTVVLLLSACGGGGSSDSSTTFTVEGRVLNGVLVGSTVDVFGASGGSVLGTATTDANGRYSARVSRAGPYRLRATGGKLNGVDYTGTLESSCPAGSSCILTPYTTVLLRLVDEHNFNQGDATALMASNLGFDGDPFAGSVPVEDFDLDAARAAIAGGDGLAEWVASIVAWATSEDGEPPPGVGGSGPAEPPAAPVDPDPVPPPATDPDPDPEPIPDPDPEPIVPVTHTVSATAGTGGSISPTSQTIEQGATAMFEVMSQTGYSIDAVSGCSGSLDDTTYITGTITGACTVSATFALNEYTLSYSAGPNGSLTGVTNQSVSHGQDGTEVTAVPDTGYSFVEWSDSSNANPRTDSSVTGDLSATASFTVNAYTVSATTGTGGRIDPASQSVVHGDTAFFTLHPDYGYSVDSVSGCGGSLDGSTYTTGAITGACTVEASFTPESYTITTEALPGGSISPTSQIVKYGATAEFTVMPDDGYRVDWVWGCDGYLDGTTYFTGMVYTPCTINVAFVEMWPPVVHLNAEDVVFIGEEVMLDGSGSYHPEGGHLIYFWSLDQTPQGSSASLTASGPVAYFTADVLGDYQVSLFVSDGTLDSDKTSTVLTGATPLGGIISTDTILSVSNSPYALLDSLQIAHGVSLLIDSGVRILGRSRGIRVFGELNIQGEPGNPVILEEVYVNGGNNSVEEPFNIIISNAIFEAGGLQSHFGPFSDSGHGGLKLRDSVLKDIPYVYVWYPVLETLFERNVFLGTGGIQAGHTAPRVVIRNNVFVDYQGAWSGFPFAVMNWAAYGEPMLVEYNSFLDTGKVTARLQYTNSAMVAVNNFWGTVDESEIQAMIYDKRVDLGVSGFIDYFPFLLEPHHDTPDPTPYLQEYGSP